MLLLDGGVTTSMLRSSITSIAPLPCPTRTTVPPVEREVLSTAPASTRSTSAKKGHGPKEIPEVIPKSGVRKCVDAIVSKEAGNEPEQKQETMEQAKEKPRAFRSGGRRWLCGTALNQKRANAQNQNSQ